MSETGRVISVGRPTGGWGIIPRGYSLPSGLANFRLGVNARPTPIKRIQTEGIGWPADVTVPCGPVIRGEADPVFDVGMQVLQVLAAGADAEKTRELFAGLFAGRIAEFGKGADKLADVKGWHPKKLAKLAEDDLKQRLLLEALLLDLDEAGPPDVLGAARRLEWLGPQAKAAGMKSELGRLEKAVKKRKAEAKAQEFSSPWRTTRCGQPRKIRRAFSPVTGSRNSHDLPGSGSGSSLGLPWDRLPIWSTA